MLCSPRDRRLCLRCCDTCVFGLGEVVRTWEKSSRLGEVCARARFFYLAWGLAFGFGCFLVWAVGMRGAKKGSTVGGPGASNASHDDY